MVQGEGWEERLKCLLFADDIVLMADSAEELQGMMDVLAEYSRKWRFEINVGKSKVMVCGPEAEPKEDEGRWEFWGKEMERVQEYKYVGVVVDEDGSWDAAAKQVAEKAEKVTGEMYGWLGKHRGVSPRAKLDVWNAMVGAVLRYGSEV